MKTEISNLELENLCKQIEDLTDSNNHTEAIKTVCGFLGYEYLHAICRESLDEGLSEKFDEIEKIL